VTPAPAHKPGALKIDRTALPATSKTRKKAQSPREAGFDRCDTGGSRAQRRGQVSAVRRSESAASYTLNG